MSHNQQDQEARKATVVMYDSPEAASIKTVTGWVSRSGHFWGDDEHMARYDGSTHTRCKCGAVVAKQSYCSTCADQKAREKFLAMPKIAWDGTAPLHLHNTDRYFFDVDALLDHCADAGCKPQDLSLVVCEPTYARQIDPTEHYADDLPEGSEVPDEIEEAFAKLNEAIRACKKPLCWYPGEVAVTPESLPTLEPEVAECGAAQP